MKSAMAPSTCCTFFLIVLCCATTQQASSAPAVEDVGSNKSKREAGGPSGLFPFPRIGRSDPDSWFIDTSGKHIYQNEKRYYRSNDEANKKKSAIIGNPNGLIAFPRTGRSLEYDQEIDPSTIQGLMKRQGLVPFPRIGRGGVQSMTSNNAGNNANGLWFGPRLGRLQKKDSYDSPWALVTLRDFPSITSRRQPESFTPQLGRESSEDVFDEYEHQRLSNEHA